MMRNKKWKTYLGVLIVLIVGASLLIKMKQEKVSGEVSISEISPVRGDIQISISATGTIQPQNRLELKPPINGRIEDILVEEGDKVKKGDVLGWMSSTERAALLDAARARDEETLEYWQEVYKPTPLIAPINGEIIVRAAEPGQTVTSTTPVLVLSDRLIVKAQVDETDIGKIKLGYPVMMSLDAYPYRNIKGVVDHIAYESELVNNVTIYEVDILPDEVPDFFRSGMSANVDITEKSKENALYIPLEAVFEEEEEKFVLIRKGDKAQPVKTKVELGISDEKNIEVISGINPEDKIIIKTKKYELPKKRLTTTPFMPSRKKKEK